jgi:hypothetical protein
LPADLENLKDLNEIPLLLTPEQLKFKFIVKCKAKRIIPHAFKEMNAPLLSRMITQQSIMRVTPPSK